MVNAQCESVKCVCVGGGGLFINGDLDSKNLWAFAQRTLQTDCFAARTFCRRYPTNSVVFSFFSTSRSLSNERTWRINTTPWVNLLSYVLKVNFYWAKANAKSNFLFDLCLRSMNIKLDSLWTHLEAMSLSPQFKRTLSESSTHWVPLATSSFTTSNFKSFSFTKCHSITQCRKIWMEVWWPFV